MSLEGNSEIFGGQEFQFLMKKVAQGSARLKNQIWKKARARPEPKKSSPNSSWLSSSQILKARTRPEPEKNGPNPSLTQSFQTFIDAQVSEH